MPGVLSKLRDAVLMSEWTFGYNCYEIGHTWSPHCTDGALEIAETVFHQAIRMYAGLYLLSHVVFSRSKDQILDPEAIKSVMMSVLRSSFFLGFNAYTMIGGFCMTRHVSGRFYYTLCATLPAFVGSLMAIQIERPSRRPALAFYCANIASECLFKIAVSRGYIRPIPNGEALLFTLSMTILLYMIRRNGFGSDPVSLALRFLMGREETLKEKHKSIENSKNIMICAHHDIPCYQYVLEGFMKPFVVGAVGQTVLSTAVQFKKFFKNPSVILENLFSSRSLKFGLFLGFFCGVFKGVNCFLRNQNQSWQDWHVIPAALAAGPFMMLSPNSTITLYLTWKMIETVYFNAVKEGYVGHPMETVCCLYAISVGVIFYVGVLEPSMLRGSYMKFIDRITEHRLHLINRNLLDVFGTGASVGYEDFFPDIDPRLCSKTFLETVFTWVI